MSLNRTGTANGNTIDLVAGSTGVVVAPGAAGTVMVVGDALPAVSSGLVPLKLPSVSARE